MINLYETYNLTFVHFYGAFLLELLYFHRFISKACGNTIDCRETKVGECRTDYKHVLREKVT